METVVAMAIVGTALAFLAYLGMCVNPDEASLQGRAARGVFVHGGENAMALATALHLAWLARGTVAFGTWFMWKRHPVVLIAYLVLVVGGYGAFVVEGYPRMPNLYMDGYHRYVGAAVFAVVMTSFCLAAFTDAGVVTRSSASEYARLFPFDGFLFEPLRLCRTCDIQKVARSKHCRVCDVCVSKFDHHCIWLNNCVGERNYRWFVLYLASNAVLLVYGATACVSVLASEVVRQRLLEATFINKATGERSGAGAMVLFHYFMWHEFPLCIVLSLCLVMGSLLVGFTAYHLGFVAFNVTTNESFKWDEMKQHRGEAVAQYLAARAQMEAEAKAAAKAAAEAAAGGEAAEATSAGAASVAAASAPHPAAAQTAAAAAASAADGTVETNGVRGVAPPSGVVACAEGRCKHAEHAGNRAAGPARRWMLTEPAPMPPNAYNLGVWRNVGEFLFPPSLHGRPRSGARPPLPALSDAALGRAPRAVAASVQPATEAALAPAAAGGAGGGGGARRRTGGAGHQPMGEGRAA